MKRLGIILLCFLTAGGAARGEFPTTGYVHQFFSTQCHNPDLEIPGENGTELTAEHYVLEIVDALNALNETPSTYLAQATTNNVVSLEWLDGQLPRLADSMECCLGGVVSPSVGECRACGTWAVESNELCMGDGQYHNGTTCESCPAGYLCPEHTGGRILCGAGNYCVNNARYECTDGRNRCPYSNHVSPPSTVACDDGYTFAYTNTDLCTGAGVYLDVAKSECLDCPDGWLCPSGTNGRTICGAGYYCVDNVRTECAHGVGQCPDDNHTTDINMPVACVNTWTVAATSTTALCTDEGQYYDGTDCADCPDGFWCPADTSGKVPCGIGFMCTGGARSACDGGATACPGFTNTAPVTE